MNKKTFIFNTAWRDVLINYPPEIRHEVYDAIIDYAAVGIVPNLSNLAQMAFQFIRREMDYNEQKYDEQIRARSEAGKKGMAKRWGERTDNKDNTVIPVITNDNKNNIYDNDNVNDNVNVIKKETKKEKTSTALVVFHPPTLDEVQAYITAKGYNIDAEAFIAYYDSNGWMVGRNKMKSWKSAIITWQKKEYSPVNTPYYDRRQQTKQATLARQNAAIDRIIEEETRKWNEQQLANGTNVEDLSAQSVY